MPKSRRDWGVPITKRCAETLNSGKKITEKKQMGTKKKEKKQGGL